ncbi:pheromone A receptor-domain-containing protein [Mycena crocata]|nr:pheromone A receptor-domain-containing protein [Mycena crocata]
MLIVLPVLSFVCAGLLAVFLTILFRHSTSNIPNVALALWLILGNLVHAINALVWSSNVENRIPVWCDIVTKLLLGATVALPGACLCSARYLELLSSNRKIYPNTYSKRIHTLIDVGLCYVLPLLYMTLHFAVQDHRISLVLCILSIYHFTRLSAQRFTAHLAARSRSVSAPMFIRRLAASGFITLTVLIFTLLPLFAPRHEHFADFRATQSLNAIFVLSDPRDIAAADRAWWTMPAVSLAFLLLALILGDEITLAGVVSRVRRRFQKQPERPARPQLSLLTFKHGLGSKSSLAAPQAVQLRSGWDDMLDVKGSRRGALPSASPSQTSRKSGIYSSSKSARSASDDDDASSSSDTASPSPSPTTPEDDAFTSSTLTYLASPVAQALGLPSPVTPPTPVYAAASKAAPVYGNVSPTVSPIKAAPPSPRNVSPTKSALKATSGLPSSPSPHRKSPARPLQRVRSPTIPPPPSTSPPSPPRQKTPAPLSIDAAPISASPAKVAPTPLVLLNHTPSLRGTRSLRTPSPPHLLPPRQPIPEDTASTISSIWDAPWPLPPVSPVPTNFSRPLSPRTPMGSDAGHAYPMYSPMEPPTPPPFEGSSVPGGGSPQRAQSLRRGLRRTWSREALARGYAGADVIYMTRTVEEVS